MTRQGLPPSAPLSDDVLIESALYWRTVMTVAQRFIAQHANRSMEFRFERFLEEPEKTLSEVYDRFSALPSSDDVLSNRLATIGGAASNNNDETYDGISSQPKNRWADELSPHQIKLIESVATPVMENIGYPTTGTTNKAAVLWSLIRSPWPPGRPRLLLKQITAPIWSAFV